MFMDNMNCKLQKELHQLAPSESLALKCFKNISSGVRVHHWVMLQAWEPHFKAVQVKVS